MDDDRQTLLYRLYSEADELLYIGITYDWGARKRAHSKDKEWWPEVSRVEFDAYDDRAEAAEAEKWEIYRKAPSHNREYHPDHVQLEWPNDGYGF